MSHQQAPGLERGISHLHLEDLLDSLLDEDFSEPTARKAANSAFYIANHNVSHFLELEFNLNKRQRKW